MTKQVLNNILLTLVTILLCFLLGEIVVRGVFHFVRNYDFEMWKYASELKQPRESSGLPFHHVPNKSGQYYGTEIKTNSLGLRDREYLVPKPSGVTRIVMLGDSFALGWGVPFQKTAAKQLERLLTGAGMPADVVNMGTGNYNSSMEVELFKQKGLGLEPDIVVLMYFANDMEPTPQLTSLRYRLFSHFYLPTYIFDKAGRLFTRQDNELMRFYRGIYDPTAPALAMNTEAIRELMRTCRTHGIKLLIVNIPDLRQLHEYPFMFATDHIRRLAEDSRTPFLDLLPVFAGQKETTLWVGEDDPHMNARANALAAEAIHQKMLNDNLAR